MTLLIADSGSTKTDWLLASPTLSAPLRFSSAGLNPCLMDDDAIKALLRSEVAPHLPDEVIDRLYFYGAGCRPDQLSRMVRLLSAELAIASVVVASDLLGAAHALCGHEAGTVAILGTGSGSAIYDGERFVQQTPSLGFILGDEGSGAALGRRLLSDVFKRQLPAHIKAAFEAECDVTIDDAIRHVYAGESPSRYLASFTHFLADHRNEPSIKELIVDEFRRFFRRNIVPYGRPDLAVGVVGSLAVVFETELQSAARAEGLEVGRVMKAPIEGILEYVTTLKQ